MVELIIAAAGLILTALGVVVTLKPIFYTAQNDVLPL